MPVRLHEPDHLLWPRYALAMVAALFLLGCLQSGNMVAVAYDLPETPLTEFLVARAENWHGWMQVLGVDAWSEWLAEKSASAHEALLLEDDLD